MHITQADINDLPEILQLQKLAYQSEAILCNDFNIPPLRQTLDEITEEFNAGIILKAIDESNRICGSVRGRVLDNTIYVGKLIVAPDCQNQGIGTKLLLAVEKCFPVSRCELFTSDKSVKNIALYQKNGYKEFKREAVCEAFDFVYMEKELTYNK